MFSLLSQCVSIRQIVAIAVCIWIESTPHCTAQEHIIDKVLILGRARLAEAHQARARHLPENQLVYGCGRWSSELLVLRAKAIAKKRLEITIGRWIAILRINRAQAAFRKVGKAEPEERVRMFRVAAENLRRAVRHSAHSIWPLDFRMVVENPSLANWPFADCIRCYAIALAVIAQDNWLTKELDEMFVDSVKMAREIREYDRWEAGIRRECAALKAAISILDSVLAARNRKSTS